MAWMRKIEILFLAPLQIVMLCKNCFRFIKHWSFLCPDKLQLTYISKYLCVRHFIHLPYLNVQSIPLNSFCAWVVSYQYKRIWMFPEEINRYSEMGGSLGKLLRVKVFTGSLMDNIWCRICHKLLLVLTWQKYNIMLIIVLNFRKMTSVYIHIIHIWTLIKTKGSCSKTGIAFELNSRSRYMIETHTYNF